MSDITMPNGIGVALGAYLTLWIAVTTFTVALVTAILTRAFLGPDAPFLKHFVRIELGPLACAACGVLYFCMGTAGGERTLRMFDEWYFVCPTAALAVGATVTICAEMAHWLRRTERPRRGRIVAVGASFGGMLAILVAVAGKATAHYLGFDFGVSVPTLALCLASFAVLTIAGVGAGAMRLGRTRG
jgi:hypothetical protein